MSKQSRIDLAHPSLFVDLYELTMARAYVAEGMNESAVFELFFRELPPTRNYVLACGHTDVLDFLENLRFEDSALEYLRSRKDFPEEFLDYLSRFRFSGDVYAVPEGTVVFPHEPVIQIHAPLIEAQIIETATWPAGGANGSASNSTSSCRATRRSATTP